MFLIFKGAKKIKLLQLFRFWLRIDIWSIEVNKMKKLTASASLLFTPPFIGELTINPFIY